MVHYFLFSTLSWLVKPMSNYNNMTLKWVWKRFRSSWFFYLFIFFQVHSSQDRLWSPLRLLQLFEQTQVYFCALIVFHTMNEVSGILTVDLIGYWVWNTMTWVTCCTRSKMCWWKMSATACIMEVTWSDTPFQSPQLMIKSCACVTQHITKSCCSLNSEYC